MHQLTVAEVAYYAHRLTEELMDFDEPISAFDSRYPHVLESCLAQPFQEFNGEEWYPTIVDKAAILFYLMVKNHPFENGNKRMAVSVTLLFLFLNGHWMYTSPHELYKVAMDVANSKADEKDKVMFALRTAFSIIIQQRRAK